MRVGVLGTGEVGRTLASRFIADGHDVRLGSRSADNPTGAAWASDQGERADHGTFADAADGVDLLVNATPGTVSLEVLATIPDADLDGAVLLDVANPLDFTDGFPPTLSLANTTSLGEEIQRAHPTARVVKALNTVHNSVMVEPDRVPGHHHLFVCGNDDAAKALVREILAVWGWRPEDRIIDLGDITNARATEMLLALWVRLYGTLGSPDFNLAVLR